MRNLKRLPAPLAAWREGGETFDYRGHKVFFRVAGEGDWLLCIHGFPTASWDWQPMWGQLTARFRVVAPDLLGFGFSEKPRDYLYSTFDQADLVAALAQKLGMKMAHVLAHDYGNTVVQELLARRGRESGLSFTLRSVCFLNGGLFVESIQPRPIQKLLLTPLAPALLRVYNKRAFRRSFAALFPSATRPSNEQLDTFWALVTHNGGKYVLAKLMRYLRERAAYRNRWVSPLQTGDIPLRFIVGPEDPVSGRPMAKRYRELIPNPDVVLLENTGHYPQVERPREVLSAFLDFVEKAGGRERQGTTGVGLA